MVTRPGRAETPSGIAAAGWWALLRRTVARASRHNLVEEAGGVAFFALLGLVPGLAALVSLYGLFADPVAVADHVARLGAMMPEDAVALIRAQVLRLAAQGRDTLGLGAVLGLAAALWSANRATRTLLRALTLVRGARETRGFWARSALALAFTLGGVLFALLAGAAVVALPVVLRLLGFGGTTLDLAFRLLRWPLLLGAVALFLAGLYRYAPCPDPCGTGPRWHRVGWGGAAAALAWLLGSWAYSWYVEELGGRGGAYGPAGALVGFMTWLWLSAAVVLAGAVLNAEMEREAGAGPAGLDGVAP